MIHVQTITINIYLIVLKANKTNDAGVSKRLFSLSKAVLALKCIVSNDRSCITFVINIVY